METLMLADFLGITWWTALVFVAGGLAVLGLVFHKSLFKLLRSVKRGFKKS